MLCDPPERKAPTVTSLSRQISPTARSLDQDAGIVFVIPPDRCFSDFYTLGELIGEGSFGAVYQCCPKQGIDRGGSWWERLVARLRPTSFPLACKVLSKAEQLSWVSKFGYEELEAALVADHPHVVRYYQFLEDGQQNYVIMDRYLGPDLFEYLNFNRRRLLLADHEREAVRIMKQILSALAFVHSKHVIHGDVKPENFLFEDDRALSLRLVDFGSAFVVGRAPALNRSERVGTNGYCALEVLDGAESTSADIFSAGVVFFIILTGEMPFECGSADKYRACLERASRESLWKVLNMRGDRLRGASDEAKDLLARMLDLNSSKRISAEEALLHSWFLLQFSPVD